MYFKKSKNKNKANKGNKRGKNGCGRNENSRKKRRNKFKREPLSELQRLAIVNAVLNKKRLFIYAESL